MKKWKKTHRSRNKKNRLCLVTISFTQVEYQKYNKYRVEKGYSWAKFLSIAIKNMVKENNFIHL